MTVLQMLTAICIVLGMSIIFHSKVVYSDDNNPSRAGRFGTKGLAITFVSSESDQQVMAAIQSRFEVAVPELPDHIDPASYSECLALSFNTSLIPSSVTS
jgi:hypothetical protein